MKPEDDRLPKRLPEEPIPDGTARGLVSKLPLTLHGPWPEGCLPHR